MGPISISRVVCKLFQLTKETSCHSKPVVDAFTQRLGVAEVAGWYPGVCVVHQAVVNKI